MLVKQRIDFLFLCIKLTVQPTEEDVLTVISKNRWDFAVICTLQRTRTTSLDSILHINATNDLLKCFNILIISQHSEIIHNAN